MEPFENKGDNKAIGCRIDLEEETQIIIKCEKLLTVIRNVKNVKVTTNNHFIPIILLFFF